MVMDAVRIIILGDGSGAVAASKQVADAYKTLGVQTVAEINKQKAEIKAAYEAIKTSGQVSAEELKQAEGARNKAIAKANEEMVAGYGSMASKIKAHYVAISAAAATIGVALSKVHEYAQLGAVALQAEEAFEHVSKSANINADATIAAMKRMTAGTIDESDIMQKAIVAITQDLDSQAELVGLAEMARVVSRTRGIDTQEALSRITDSIANQIPRALRTMGLVSKEQMALLNQAAKAGAEELDIFSMALMNARIKEMELNGMSDTAAETMQRHRAEVHELKEEIGKLAIVVTGAAYSALKKWIEVVREAKEPGYAEGKRRKATEALAAVGGEYAAPEFVNGVRMYGPEAYREAEESTKAWRDQRTEQMKDMVKAGGLAEEWKKTVSQINREIAGSGLDEFRKRLLDVEHKAAEWREKFGDKPIIDKWEKSATADVIADREKTLTEILHRSDEKETTTRTKQAEEFEDIYRDLSQSRMSSEDAAVAKIYTEEDKLYKKILQYSQQEGADVAKAAAAREWLEEDTTRKVINIRTKAAAEEAEMLATQERAQLSLAEKQNLLWKPDLIEQQLAIEQRLLDTYKEELKVTTDETAQRLLRDKISKSELEIASKRYQQTEYSDNFAGGLQAGARDWLTNLKSEFQIAKDMAKETAESMRQAIEDYFYDPSTMDAQKFMSSLRRILAKAESEIMMDLIRSELKAAQSSSGILGSILGWLGFGGKSTPGVNDMTSGWGTGGIDPSVNYGPAFDSGGVMQGPGTFRVGPIKEAAVPLPDGRSIPVDIRGDTGAAAAPVTNVYVMHPSGTEARVTETRRADGGKDVRVMVEEVMADITNSGRGPFNAAMRKSYGLRPVLSGR